MSPECPTGKISRTLTGGRTAVKAGKKILSYYVKRPFMSGDKREQEKGKAVGESAKALFQGLSLLKGTALKMAQLLSLESDLLPEAICQELSKAYHQVPPINKALVRQIVQTGLGDFPENIFSEFNTTAFAAASLGQVHYAKDNQGNDLAVKLQYPGIADTIKSDVSMLRQLMKPMLKKEQLDPTIDEISQRLHEEIDYLREADNLLYFSENLNLKSVAIPEVRPDLTSKTILSTTLMPGKPIDQWLKTNPSQKDKNYIASQLQTIFLKTLYELNCIHADPNPGNFIIAEDLTIGLVDFGCIKQLPPGFVEQYRQLCIAAGHQMDKKHLELMIQTGLLPDDLSSENMAEFKLVSDAIREWFGFLVAEKNFDFKKHPAFLSKGREVMKKTRHLRKHFKVNPNFLFLDRTRYGLLRIYEMLEARLSLRNTYEW